MTVRPAAPGDAGALSALARRVFAETYGPALSPEGLRAHLETALAPEALAAEIGGAAHFLLCEAQAELAGFLKLEADPQNPTAVEIVKLYVDAHFRGSGAASALMAAGLERARAGGFGAVWLLVWEQNSRALRFYRRHGFEVAGRREVWVGETVFQDHLMRKELR